MTEVSIRDWLEVHGFEQHDLVARLQEISIAHRADTPVAHTEPMMCAQEAWRATVGALTAAFPNNSSIIQSVAESVRLVSDADASVTCTRRINGQAEVRVRFDRPSVGIARMAHEFGHALQLVLLPNHKIPPVEREFAAFVTELIAIDQFTLENPDFTEALHAARDNRADYFRKKCGDILLFDLSANSNYRYEWNYPISYELASAAVNREARSFLWQALLREVRIADLSYLDIPYQDAEPWARVEAALYASFPENALAVESALGRVVLCGESRGPVRAVSRGPLAAPILRHGIVRSAHQMLDLAYEAGRAVCLAATPRAWVGEADLAFSGYLAQRLMTRHAVETGAPDAAGLHRALEARAAAARRRGDGFAEAGTQLGLPLKTAMSEADILDLVELCSDSFDTPTLWAFFKGDVSPQLLRSKTILRQQRGEGFEPLEATDTSHMTALGVKALACVARGDARTRPSVLVREAERLGDPRCALLLPPSLLTGLGVAVSALASSPYHDGFDLEHYLPVEVLPALGLNQTVGWLDAKGNVVGFVSYARLAPEVASEIHAKGRAVGCSEWRSGPAAFINDLITIGDAFRPIMAELKGHIFAEDVVTSLRRAPDRSVRRVNRWTGDALRAAQRNAAPEWV
ncbi:MAG: toxin-activating lysine-acyltransferase [Paracoccaceae bacterium]